MNPERVECLQLYNAAKKKKKKIQAQIFPLQFIIYSDRNPASDLRINSKPDRNQGPVSAMQTGEKSESAAIIPGKQRTEPFPLLLLPTLQVPSGRKSREAEICPICAAGGLRSLRSLGGKSWKCSRRQLSGAECPKNPSAARVPEWREAKAKRSASLCVSSPSADSPYSFLQLFVSFTTFSAFFPPPDVPHTHHPPPSIQRVSRPHPPV